MASSASTLPELLASRAAESSVGIGFLDSDGGIVKSLSYADLFNAATRTSQQLIALGLNPESDIVITSFPDHESHIRVFWACCFGEY